jgi:hypothetical protein
MPSRSSVQHATGRSNKQPEKRLARCVGVAIHPARNAMDQFAELTHSIADTRALSEARLPWSASGGQLHLDWKQLKHRGHPRDVRVKHFSANFASRTKRSAEHGPAS